MIRNANPYKNTDTKPTHLNLLQMTAMMSSTSTVMIAIVMIRFVAILHSISILLLKQMASICNALSTRISTARDWELLTVSPYPSAS